MTSRATSMVMPRARWHAIQSAASHKCGIPMGSPAHLQHESIVPSRYQIRESRAPNPARHEETKTMKTMLFAILLEAAACSSNAGSLSMPGSLGFNPAGASSAPIFETANRSGSRRVGGRNSSGKGSHYVGGRRR